MECGKGEGRRRGRPESRKKEESRREGGRTGTCKYWPLVYPWYHPSPSLGGGGGERTPGVQGKPVMSKLRYCVSVGRKAWRPPCPLKVEYVVLKVVTRGWWGFSSPDGADAGALFICPRYAIRLRWTVSTHTNKLQLYQVAASIRNLILYWCT